MELTIDRAGRVVIPKDVRDRLGFTAGSTIELLEQDGGVRLEPKFEEPELVEGPHGLLCIKHPAGAHKFTNADVLRTIHEMRRDREDRIGGRRRNE